MSGAKVRVDQDREETLNSANIMYYQDGLKFKGKIAQRRLWITSDTASSTVNYTPVH